jgi:hypothetical protein
MTNSFRIPTGQRKLRGLFFETTGADKTSVVYTLKDRDHEGYPSLYRLYMEADDPTEYSFAVSHLDGWDHWEILCQCTWFKPYVARWRRELEIRFRSRSLKAIQGLASSPDSKDYHQANKFLVSAGWQDSRKAGRPSKAEIQKAAKAAAQEITSTEDEFNRVTGIIN